MPSVALLADRLRVEERLLTTAFASRGWEARLVHAGDLALPLAPGQDPDGSWQVPAVVVDRTLATPESAALSALLSAAGSAVVNRTATTRLLGDRLALLRHLVAGGIPIPRTVVAFSPEAALRAIDDIGYPVFLKSLTVDPVMPVALVEDRDAAEALIEHRSVLGNERAVLVQRAAGDPATVTRLVVVGEQLIAAARHADGELRLLDVAEWQALAAAVAQRLGSGVYEIEVNQVDGCQTVLSAANLGEFRSLAERGVAVADAVADYVIAVTGYESTAQGERSERAPVEG